MVRRWQWIGQLQWETGSRASEWSKVLISGVRQGPKSSSKVFPIVFTKGITETAFPPVWRKRIIDGEWKH